MRFAKLVFTAIFIILLVLTSVVPLYAEDYLGAVLGVSKKDKEESKSQGRGAESKVIVGKVEKVSENKVTLEEKKGKKKTEAIIDQDTKVVGQERKALRWEEIKVKDKIAIISTESAAWATRGGERRKALKVFVKPATSSGELKRRAVQGIITNISGLTITLAHQIQRDRVYTVVVNEQTVIKIKGVEKATMADLKVGQRMAAVGNLTGTGGILAKRIHVIPGKATGIFERYPIATPSATPIATPTAIPITTPTVVPSPTLIPSPTLELSPTPAL